MAITKEKQCKKMVSEIANFLDRELGYGSGPALHCTLLAENKYKELIELGHTNVKINKHAVHIYDFTHTGLATSPEFFYNSQLTHLAGNDFRSVSAYKDKKGSWGAIVVKVK